MRWLVLLLLMTGAGCATTGRAPSATVPYAWVTFDGNGLRASDAAGLADQRNSRRLTIDDPVRIASVSKLVVALGVMRMVEAGQLDLDRDVSDYLGWRLQHPAFPDAPITLRQLLSHTSALTDNVDYAVPLGTELRAVVSDVAWDRGHRPGRYFRYANLNYPIIASVMERAGGERFDRLMARLVLRPLQIDACFNWTTCSDAAAARAVVLYTPTGAVVRDDLRGRRPDCPVLVRDGATCDLSTYQLGSNGALFSPQGGLRISARDMAVIGRMLLNRGTHAGERLLSEASVSALLSPEWRFGGSNGATENGFHCAYGLGVQLLPEPQRECRDNLFGGRQMAGHAGEAYGVRSGLWIDPVSGEGIAFFATNNGDTAVAGRSAFTAIEEWLARRMRR